MFYEVNDIIFQVILLKSSVVPSGIAETDLLSYHPAYQPFMTKFLTRFCLCEVGRFMIVTM